jgi:hypothetical protein
MKVTWQQIFGPIEDVRFVFTKGFWPTLSAVMKDPVLLFHPKKLCRILFAHAWAIFGKYIDENSKEVKIELLKQASGVLLDVGAGIIPFHIAYMDR